MRLCIIDGCNRRHQARDYCKYHWKRWRLYGDPLKRLAPIYNKNQGCKVDGCEGRHHSFGYCGKHHAAFYKYGDPLIKKAPTPNGKQGCKIYECNRKHYSLEYCERHYENLIRQRSKGRGDLFLYISMNSVRNRDNNTCKWYNCKRSARDGWSIHVNHIFPISEYPELKYIEEYMICYCKEHHYLWHKARGDQCIYLFNMEH